MRFCAPAKCCARRRIISSPRTERPPAPRVSNAGRCRRTVVKIGRYETLAYPLSEGFFFRHSILSCRLVLYRFYCASMDRTSLIAELNSRGLRDEALTGPLYKRLAQTLTGLIQEGLLKPGTALPGERDLAEALKLGRVTVRTAYRDLMASGALESRHGSGTFVSSRVERMEQSLWRLSSFSADMRSRGRLLTRTDIVAGGQYAVAGGILPARPRRRRAGAEARPLAPCRRPAAGD